ncbi:FKBP2 [Cervus elaphus hippelaphus]|uniref:peptidylprolyl isomerase n=1 Tax=Cervus elaphus hippelaphus TaxID=46360 RepID=A0A212DGG2_CEREH|nr:FKBP2 [Cervus elaphus hippelaphus]
MMRLRRDGSTTGVDSGGAARSGDVWVPRGRPPAAAADVWVCWAGGNWVWREWGRPVGATALQPDRVWTLRKGTGGEQRGGTLAAVASPDPLSPLLGSSGKPPSHWTVLSICLSALVTATGAEGKRKLQIGVKKRVDHCPIKSRKGDVLHMHYTGKLEDGTEFDSSLPQNQPFVFSLGTGQVIKGWDQGLLGMCEGEKRKLVIPSELGGATLVFEVELLKIERRSEL